MSRDQKTKNADMQSKNDVSENKNPRRGKDINDITKHATMADFFHPKSKKWCINTEILPRPQSVKLLLSPKPNLADGIDYKRP